MASAGFEIFTFALYQNAAIVVSAPREYGADGFGPAGADQAEQAQYLRGAP